MRSFTGMTSWFSDMQLKEEIRAIVRAAKEASRFLSDVSSKVKDDALKRMAEGLTKNGSFLKEENQKDIQSARADRLSPALIDRLTLTDSRIAAVADGLMEVAKLPDPVGEVTRMWRRPNGLLVGRMRIPLGVIGIIYEARPNVTADAAGLCIKSGNAVVLRGGSEAIRSNMAIARILQKALKDAGIPEAAIGIITTTDRKAIAEMLTLEDDIDLIIPRGGESLIRMVAEKSRIPVIKHYKGVCHIFVDESADLAMARTICYNAKVQRPAVCNAMETLLVHEKVSKAFLPEMAEEYRKAGVELRGCERTRKVLPDAKRATEEDWYAEYLDLILAVRVVKDIDEAIEHIARYGSMHTEAIVTKDYAHAQRFLKKVNSSTVLVNASTRFSDGFELGLGAEIGISTTKVHAFGPMGLEELTTQKFIVYGDGQIRS